MIKFIQLCFFFHQFCDYLHENAAVLRSVDESFSSFYNSIKTDNLISMVREEYSQDVILDFVPIIIIAV